jgi:hypothetical protein
MGTLANEQFCYVQNNVTKHARSLVALPINGFLHDGLPRLMRRQNGNKRKLDCDDILNLFVFADSVVCSLATFVAVNLQHQLSVAPGNMDLYALAVSLAASSLQLYMLTKRYDALSTCGIASNQL